MMQHAMNAPGGTMRLRWDAIYAGGDNIATGTPVVLAGHPVFPQDGVGADTFLLAGQAPCCGGHGAHDARWVVEIHADTYVAWHGGPVKVEGNWQRLCDDVAGWRYRIGGARVTPVIDPIDAGGMSRRGFLALGALAGLAACGTPAAGDGPARASSDRLAAPATPADSATVDASTLAWMRENITVDMHSHAGHINLGRTPVPHAYTPVAAPMRSGGMDVACLAIVADSSVDHVVESASGRRRIVAYREPAPGEMASRGEAAFVRLHDLMRLQGLAPVTTAASLAAARLHGPCVIVAAEGADFLEGDLGRLDDAYHRHALRHLQLTHYRVNELGDIQTAPPVHGGLTAFGDAAVRQCNRLGIVVDVAHGTEALVRRAAQVTTRPLVLSHTSLRTGRGRYSRTISPDHARLIAGTDGVIGIWPVASTFPTLAAMADGIRRMADVVGVRHMGIGTDMLGLLGPSVIGGYGRLPALARALLDAGFSRDEAGLILGGNYARVYAASMTA
jgi:membrane dipeptidase